MRYTIVNDLSVLCGCGHAKAEHNHHTDFCRMEDCVGCCEFISDSESWRAAKKTWDYETEIDERMMAEAFHQERNERRQRRLDNEYPSGSTDLGNRGGATFSY